MSSSPRPSEPQPKPSEPHPTPTAGPTPAAAPVCEHGARERFPGADVVAAGLADIAAGRRSVEALLVAA
ncbi:MAG: hypothetical protein ACRDKL_08165, partial [Solirubrobacteraceae bacterium]